MNILRHFYTFLLGYSGYLVSFNCRQNLLQEEKGGDYLKDYLVSFVLFGNQLHPVSISECLHIYFSERTSQPVKLNLNTISCKIPARKNRPEYRLKYGNDVHLAFKVTPLGGTF